MVLCVVFLWLCCLAYQWWIISTFCLQKFFFTSLFIFLSPPHTFLYSILNSFICFVVLKFTYFSFSKWEIIYFPWYLKQNYTNVCCRFAWFSSTFFSYEIFIFVIIFQNNNHKNYLQISNYQISHETHLQLISLQARLEQKTNTASCTQINSV